MQQYTRQAYRLNTRGAFFGYDPKSDATRSFHEERAGERFVDPAKTTRLLKMGPLATYRRRNEVHSLMDMKEPHYSGTQGSNGHITVKYIPVDKQDVVAVRHLINDGKVSPSLSAYDTDGILESAHAKIYQAQLSPQEREELIAEIVSSNPDTVNPEDALAHTRQMGNLARVIEQHLKIEEQPEETDDDLEHQLELAVASRL